MPPEEKDGGPPLTPEELQARIDEMRARGKRDRSPSLGHAVAVFLSMGITMAGAMYAGYLGGAWLTQYTHNQIWLPVMLVVGLAGGASAVYQMLKPFLD